ncbi:hypothetical protein [Rhodococcus phage RGL3]|uniref:Uncharacterized protein n=1 Tax=Rhodococcus phage RGL3 TaxID=2922221 RepID=G9FHM8_9CAUD|nr:hypothetical protein RoPhRGL3_gp36 [Rhodococcus phage RGL3]AEV52116.1 hypothetical protein [Rhodococcus phage RGL3]
MNSLFDPAFQGIPGGEMYRSWVDPTLHKGQRPARIENWPAEDLEMYCGIYN